jgi:hypothetical protein
LLVQQQTLRLVRVRGCNFVRATRLVRLAVAMWSCLLGTAAQPAALSSLPATERILMVVLSRLKLLVLKAQAWRVD